MAGPALSAAGRSAFAITPLKPRRSTFWIGERHMISCRRPLPLPQSTSHSRFVGWQQSPGGPARQRTPCPVHDCEDRHHQPSGSLHDLDPSRGNRRCARPTRDGGQLEKAGYGSRCCDPRVLGSSLIAHREKAAQRPGERAGARRDSRGAPHQTHRRTRAL